MFYQRYGALGAAMTANVNTYRRRSAAREVGKVFGFDTETLGRLSQMVGGFEWRGPKDTFDNQVRGAALDLKHARIARRVGLLLEDITEPDSASPLSQMDDDERLVSDYHGIVLTTEPHPWHIAGRNCGRWESSPPPN
jgi:hypothetical protein